MNAKKNPNLDIGRNSSIYFAIGLNIMLLLTWNALEYRSFETAEPSIVRLDLEAEYEEDIPITNLNTPPPPPPPVAISESIEVVESIAEIEETVIESTESSQEDAIIAPEPVIAVEDVNVEEVEEDVEVPFSVIENIPVFPGCEGLSNAASKACFQTKMNAHITSNFKYPEEALELGLQGRVSVMFIIDEHGQITGVRSRGPEKILEQEAERIIRLLPKMKPGKQRGKPVKVSYAVPIFFRYKAPL
ncbi:energy transducer TonB [Formosa sediminum]|uniref:Energy transducer TonB n=1 Tax=Formosa sediminum TaxID=2594004 RepID=A0A516GRP4_9FLAO|nr:energy transducer TonB [Formosa sediminum]QDO94191.1 energy transducer TonB [Formosa sediminum]